MDTEENSNNLENAENQKIGNANYDDIDNDALLKQIFRSSKEDSTKLVPILIKNGSEIIKKVFTLIPNISNCKDLKDYIIKKINLIKEIKKIIGNAYEILYIIFDNLSQYNTSPFIYFTDLYIKFISLSGDETYDNNKKIIIEEIDNIFSWFISCGLLKKTDVDHIYQKMALFQLEKTLKTNVFDDLITLLQIIYGKSYDSNLVKNFIGKRYIYFYDKETSLIKTNISQLNSISIKNGFSLVLWFYLNNYDESPNCSLCEIKINNSQKLNFILTDNNDIKITVNDSNILNETKNKAFKLEKEIWTQFKIEFKQKEISIFTFQKKPNEIKINSFDEKNYKLNVDDFKYDNCSITEISFFKNYVGIIGSIIFFNKIITNEENNIIPIDSLYGLENRKINEFIRNKKLFSGLYFFFSPSLYLYDQNKIIDSANNVIGELPERKYHNENSSFNLNSILTFHNYIKNIFYLGGCSNLLPLFEIFYKFSLEENNFELEKNIFTKLFKLLEIVFYDKIKNSLLPLRKETSFFESLQLFLEKIDSKYYCDNETLLVTLINIANYFNEIKTLKIVEPKEKYGYFMNILFDPKIIMKFDLNLQEKLLKQIDIYSVLMPVEKINLLLLLLSQKYEHSELEKSSYFKTLYKYINKIFENINIDDSQRESLFLLYKNKNIYSKDLVLSDYLFIQIMQIFILYLDLGVNSKFNEEELKRRKTTINYFLYSENNFIESLLNYLSETNIHVKKVIINFLRVLTQMYGDLLDQYFIKERKNKKSKKKINKEEFYDFIKENIAPNYTNADIKDEELRKKSVKNPSIFFLEEEEDEININNEQNSINKAQELTKKRSKSLDNNKNKEKKIRDKIITNILDNNKKSKKSRKDSFSKKSSKNLSENLKAFKDKEKRLNQNSHIKKLNEQEKFVVQNTKFEISFILYNWLASLITEEEKQKAKNKIKEESIQNVIDFIVKFISYSNELEVIYRTLLLLWNQKDRSKNGKQSLNDYDNIYSKLLNNLSKNSLFIQALLELMINSYLYKNINNYKENDFFEIITKSKENSLKMKEKYFNLIYDHSKELLFDIFFDERNSNKNEVIIKLFCIILKMSNHYEKNNDEQKKNLLFKFIRVFFLEIIKKYEQIQIFEDYITLFTFLIEYTFLIKTASYYSKNSYEKIKNDRYHCLPDFLISGIIYEEKVAEWSGYEIYMNVFDGIKKLFCIDDIFSNLEMIFSAKNNINENFDKKKNIFIYDIELVKSLLNECINIKNRRDEKKNEKIKLIFSSYQPHGYDNSFPLINIISLFNSLCLYLYYKDTGENDNKKINIISLLNDIQNYLVFLILISCLIKENYSFPQKRTYEEVQTLIYKNLYFNIMNLIKHLNDKANQQNYLQILYNIILFLSELSDIEQKEAPKKKKMTGFFGLFSSYVDLSKVGPIQLMNFYTNNLSNLFNESNLKLFRTNTEKNKEKALELINDNITKNIEEDPSFDLYEITLFEKIIKKRDNDLKLKIRLLINPENEFRTAINDYKKIYLKVKYFQNKINFDEIKTNGEELFKIKRYRKTKKDLYSFNNSYSNLATFYKIGDDKNSNQYLLKYKISNFLSKDMTRKLIKPIIDINYYLPNFRKFKYESNSLYHHPNSKIYSIDLEIFNTGGEPPLSPDIKNKFYKDQYYIEDNVCYIITTNHIKGKIFHLNDLQNSYLYFCMTKLPSEEELKKNYEDYDSLNNSCFSSLFRNNLNKQDHEIYLKIDLSEIIFIFNRKYSFKDNSIEIFTSNHRSYYFKFKNNEKRNKFREHLLSILNKDSSIFKKLYKPISSINENNKSINLGYYKDCGNYSEYSNISSIRELWKNNQISTLEYIMWINIYGNRSFRDISQYPVLPWIIDDYKTKTFQDIVKNDCIRDFKLPMGMMALDEKGKDRAEGYISTYKSMSLDLKEEEIINFKVKEEDDEENDDKIETNVNSNADDSNLSENNINTSDSDINKIISKKNKSFSKIPKYNYDIDKLYMDLDIEYEKIPYCYGSHYSNGMYVSHFLGRLFPYSFTMIEIQGSGFDVSERLFLCLDKTFLSSTSEKCDIRELIPEFYTMPELFLNINKLDFGEIDLSNFVDSVEYINEVIDKNIGGTKVKVEDVLLPIWCKYNPYYFILKKRELLEYKTRIDLNPWIDLIFGFTQRGVKAQAIGNVFLPYTYDGVMNYRVDEENILKDRENNEYLMRLFELGVNPTKVFKKKNTEKGKKEKHISFIKNIEEPIPYISGFEGRIRFLANIGNNESNLFIYYKNHKVKKIIYDDKVPVHGNYNIKEVSNYKDLKHIFNQDISCQTIIKNLFKSKIMIITGFYSGAIYLINLGDDSKLNNEDINNLNITTKFSKEEEMLLLNYGKGIVTSLEVSKDEKYIAYGNDKGTLVILEFDYDIFLENNESKTFLKVLKIISSHGGHTINYISINSDLNLLADCSYDNFIHIYCLPKCNKINSIFINDFNYKADYIFLSAQPLASIVLYSNKSYQFKCYNINGHDLDVKQNDKESYDELNNKNYQEFMISPLVFTDCFFTDYLLYVFGYQFIILRKLPLMDINFKFKFYGDEIISLINISLSKKFIYAVDNNNKRVYLIKYSKPNKAQQVSRNNSLENANSK